MGEEIVLDANLVTLIAGVLIPVLTGLITKYEGSTAVKQIVAIVLSGAAAMLAAAVSETGDAVLTVQTLFDAAVIWVIQIATYLGIYKPHDANAKLAPNAGIG
jgi:hypothetical protein